jgi:hypothetical protein
VLNGTGSAARVRSAHSRQSSVLCGVLNDLLGEDGGVALRRPRMLLLSKASHDKRPLVHVSKPFFADVQECAHWIVSQASGLQSRDALGEAGKFITNHKRIRPRRAQTFATGPPWRNDDGQRALQALEPELWWTVPDANVLVRALRHQGRTPANSPARGVRVGFLWGRGPPWPASADVGLRCGPSCANPVGATGTPSTSSKSRAKRYSSPCNSVLRLAG